MNERFVKTVKRDTDQNFLQFSFFLIQKKKVQSVCYTAVYTKLGSKSKSKNGNKEICFASY